MTCARDEAGIRALVEAVEDCQLPLEDWHHREHLTLALYYLETRPEAEAVAAIRTTIQRYNASQGIETTRESGYHETLTLFFMTLLQRFRATAEPTWSLAETTARALEALADWRGLVRRHYSRERILSWEARRSWVPPDLLPLDAT